MIDEKTFNEDIKEIHQSIHDISDNLLFHEGQLQILRKLSESYVPHNHHRYV